MVYYGILFTNQLILVLISLVAPFKDWRFMGRSVFDIFLNIMCSQSED